VPNITTSATDCNHFAKKYCDDEEHFNDLIAAASVQVSFADFIKPWLRDNSIVIAALDYAERGWPVITLNPLTKVSYKSAEHSDGRPWGQTTDEAEIRRDFNRRPDANVGVVCGAVSGVFVVETDTAEGHGDGVDGAASLVALQGAHTLLPPTLQAISPSGSVHYYFRHPGTGTNIKNSASKIATGIDVRGDGGMVVAPPSVKPGKGAYRWLNDLPIADAPVWLLDLVVTKEVPSISEQALAKVKHPERDPHLEHAAANSNGRGYIDAVLRGEYDAVASLNHGRNVRLNDAAVKLGHYVAGGVLDEQEAIDRLMAACQANALIAHTGKAQCLATIASGMKKGKQEPKGIPERQSADVKPLRVEAKDGQLSQPEWRECLASGKPKPSMHNACLAIESLGVTCSQDTFHNKTLFGYAGDKVRHELSSVVGEISDDGIIALRKLMSNRFGFDMDDKYTRDAVRSLAIEHRFNPVCDLIDKAEAEWDDVKRLDRMAADYFNCEDTPLNAACMRKTMIGLVARARVPGIKFDTITVLESPEGFNKSTAWRVLAGDENFSDEQIIGKSGREAQEQLSGIWIHENAELAGMTKTEVKEVKAYASRMVDIARPAFGHYVVKQPRHSIEVGTTNSSEYLLSQDGNRRFWPMTVTKAIDIEKLRRDRMHLIGEAARYQSDGESVVLDETLWPAAGAEQEKRRIKDPWEDALEHIPTWWSAIEGYDDDHRPIKNNIIVVHLVEGQEVVAAATLMKYVLDTPIGRQSRATSMRLSTTMQQLGWQRHKNGYVSINGERVKGYYRTPPTPDTATDTATALKYDKRFHPGHPSEEAEATPDPAF
jgi:hypothetical protein